MNRKMVRIVTLTATCIACLALLTSCSFVDSLIDQKDDHDLNYTASTRFLYSTDDGASWSETIRSVYVGEPYYLAVEMQVTQSAESREEKTVEATITVPKTEGLECALNSYPGSGLLETSENDKATQYKFKVVAGTSPAKFRVMFECKPNEPGRTSFTVQYDDKLNDAWDSTGTINYVTKESGATVQSSEDQPDKETEDESGNLLSDLLNSFG